MNSDPSVPFLSTPVELSFKIVEGLSPTDLAAYCATSHPALNLCSDQYFWRQKIAKSTRREIQEDWMVELAQNDQPRLLSYLLDALEDVGLVIDQRIIVLTLMHLYSNNATGSIVKRLEEKMDLSYVEDQIMGSSLVTLREYTIRKRDDTLHNIQQWIAGKEHSLHAGVYDLVDPTQLFVNSLLDPILKKQPSPSSFLGVSIPMRPVEQLAILNNLRLTMVPYAANNRRISSLIVYREDVETLEHQVQEALGLYGWPSDTLIVDLFHSVIGFLSLQDAKTVFPEDWTGFFQGDDPAPPLCRHEDTFKHIAQLVNYAPEYVVYGYLSMEVEEWIEWLEAIPRRIMTESKLRIAQQTVEHAKIDGYSYFANSVTSYLKGE